MSRSAPLCITTSNKIYRGNFYDDEPCTDELETPEELELLEEVEISEGT